MKWIIVGFNHPILNKSLIYKQNIKEETMIKAIKEGIEKGCNLFSIRGIPDLFYEKKKEIQEEAIA